MILPPPLIYDLLVDHPPPPSGQVAFIARHAQSPATKLLNQHLFIVLYMHNNIMFFTHIVWS
jgi:hypothetical protein